MPRRKEKGKWYWKIELFHYQTRIACSEIWSFYIKKSSLAQSPLAQTKPTITNLEFFPIAIYGGAAANLKELRKIGFNAVQLSGHGFENTMELLNTAHRNGLKALLPLPPQDLNLEEFYKSRPGLRSLLFSEAVLAWYLADEPEGRSVFPKIIKDRLDFLRKNGFIQPGAIALARPWRALDYAPGVNVFMSDQYPIPFNPLSWLSESLDTVWSIIALDPEKRSWAVIQAFGWQYSSPQARATGLARNPTPEEVKALTYLAITHGARGIFYYTYKGGQYNIKEHPKLWEGVKETVGELRDISSILFAPKADENISMVCESKDEWGYPAIHYILKKDTISGKDNGSLYLIAVNTLNRKVSAKFKFKDLQYRLKDSSLELDFLPLERKVLHIPTDYGFNLQ